MIPVSEPVLTEADYASVMGALKSGWISGAGPHVEAFESHWAAYCGRKHGIALANGTVALQVLRESDNFQTSFSCSATMTIGRPGARCTGGSPCR